MPPLTKLLARPSSPPPAPIAPPSPRRLETMGRPEHTQQASDRTLRASAPRRPRSKRPRAAGLRASRSTLQCERHRARPRRRRTATASVGLRPTRRGPVPDGGQVRGGESSGCWCRAGEGRRRGRRWGGETEGEERGRAAAGGERPTVEGDRRQSVAGTPLSPRSNASCIAAMETTSQAPAVRGAGPPRRRCRRRTRGGGGEGERGGEGGEAERGGGRCPSVRTGGPRGAVGQVQRQRPPRRLARRPRPEYPYYAPWGMRRGRSGAGQSSSRIAGDGRSPWRGPWRVRT